MSRFFKSLFFSLLVSLVMLYALPALTHAVVLYDNGPLVTHPGGGAGGADASAVQTSLGMTVLGFSHQLSTVYRVADDFTITDPAGWQIDQIVFFAYQTGSTTTSTINHMNLRIWNGSPDNPASTVVWGDTTTNILANTVFSNIYRATDTSLTSNQRPIMSNTVNVNTILPAGTYWLDWQTGGTLGSGPFAPPITILGQTTTGNGMQYNGTLWANAIDVGQQGFPFIINGLVQGTLQGTVADANTGSSISGATVTATGGYSTTTDGSGFYQFASLPVGTYDVTASASGYQSSTATGVSVTSGNTTTQDFSLSASQLSANPTSLNVTVYTTNPTTSRNLNLSNTGGVNATFNLGEASASPSPSGHVSIPRSDGNFPRGSEPVSIDKAPKILRPNPDAGSAVLPLSPGSLVSGHISIPRSDGNFPRGSEPVSIGKAPKIQRPNPDAGNAILPLSPGSPVFAIKLFPATPEIVSFDSDTPGTWNVINSLAGSQYFAGDFLNGDFSKLYVIDYGLNQLHTVNTTTGAVTVIGSSAPSGGETWSGMTASQSGTLYASSTSCGSSTLYTINPSTGASSVIGTITNGACVIDIAISAQTGQMYGVDILNDTLININPATGAGTVIGSIGFDANYAQGMDFDDSTGTLYLAAYNLATSGELRIADTTTGNTALVGAFPGGAEVDSLAFATTSPSSPVFAVKLFPATPELVSFGSAIPGAWNVIAALSGSAYFAGDFLNNDFSKLYVIDNVLKQLHTVNTTTGAVTVIGSSTPVSGETWTGITGSKSGILYASSSTCTSSTLYTINPSTGAATVIGTITNGACIIDIAISAQTGQMYGVDIFNDTLININPATGAGTVIGSIGFNANFAQGMDFDDSTGTLYLAAYNSATSGELRIADTTTGNTSLVGAFPGGAEVDSLAFATVYDVPWLSEAPTSGTITAGGNQNIVVSFDATSMSVGTYDAQIGIINNSPYGTLVVPVTMNVAVDSIPPTGTITINGGDSYTTTTAVTLTLSCSDAGSGCSQMCISNTTTCSAWEAYATSKAWTLTSGGGVTKTVYARFRDNANNTSIQYSDTIYLATDRLVCASGCTYSTVQSAINATGPGDTIKVAQGTYNENISVSSAKTFSIQCGWDTGFTTQTDDPTLTVLSGDITGDGFGDGTVISLLANAGINIEAEIDNCTITKGSAAIGGGINIASSDGNIQLTLENNMILRNAATTAGGGIGAEEAGYSGTAALTLTNNIIAANTATNGGGGIYIGAANGTATLNMTNNTISDNEAPSGSGLYAMSTEAGTTTATSKNNIIWGNDLSTSEVYLAQSGSTTTLTTTYSDIGTVVDNTGAYAAGTGDINADPVLINPALDNYRLNSDSPCIDTGTATGAPSEDYEGDTRPQGAGYDIGADEYVSSAYTSLELLSLDGAERIKSGKPYDITWGAPAEAVKFKVKYSLNNGLTWLKPLNNTVTGADHYRWNVPALTKNKKKCLVKVSAFNAANVKIGSDTSDARFAIDVVRLLTPNGGETLTAGTPYTVRWKTTPYPKRAVASVVIYYTKNNGLTWKKRATLTGNPGTYDWTTPAFTSAKTKCKVKVVLKDSAGKSIGNDISDAVFTISP